MQSKPESGQYRNAIDRGATHDKVPAVDPAAAPLETDAEANGTPTARAPMAAAERDQERQPVSGTPATTFTAPGRGQYQIPAPINAWMLGAGLVAAAIAALVVACLALP